VTHQVEAEKRMAREFEESLETSAYLEHDFEI
jgi:hypothetical protein